MNKLACSLVLPAAALLASCGGKSGDADGGGERASEPVLGGTISDAMLPLDSATSTAPLQAPETPRTIVDPAVQAAAQDAAVATGTPEAADSPTPSE